MYACTHYRANSTVSISKLLHMGEADRVLQKLLNHGKRDCRERELELKKRVWFAFAPDDGSNPRHHHVPMGD